MDGGSLSELMLSTSGPGAPIHLEISAGVIGKSNKSALASSPSEGSVN